MLTTLVEYAGFMALIGSLFVIAGGIHINMTGRSTPAVNTGPAGARRDPVQPHRHDRRLDAADSAVPAHQQIPRRAVSRRLLHFHRQQHRRRADAHRRSAAVPRLPQGRAVFLAADEGEHCARVAAVRRRAARLVLRHRRAEFPQAQAGAGETRGRPGRTGRLAQFHLPVRHHRLGARAEGGLAEADSNT